MRISELAKRTNCDIETIRYYEKSGLLPEPARTSSGYREYQPEGILQNLNEAAGSHACVCHDTQADSAQQDNQAAM
jgi:hypothetical protein